MPNKCASRGVFVGLATVDVVYDVDRFPSADSKVTARSQSTYAGGPATNAAITFGHLGGSAALVTAMGRHPLTALIREEIKQYGIDLFDLIPNRAEMPAISAVAVDPSGKRNVISANAASLSGYSERVVPELLDSASVVLIDGHLMKACMAWACAATERGIPVVLDGGSWKQGTERLLPNVEIAICSADFQPPGCHDPEQVIAFLRTRGVRHVAITAGAGPIRFVSGGESGAIPVSQVPVVDTMGAGDILHGAFAHYAAAGLNFPEALARAADLASHSCRFRGTRAWMNGLPKQFQESREEESV